MRILRVLETGSQQLMGKKICSPRQVLVYFKTTKKQQTILERKMREWKKQ